VLPEPKDRFLQCVWLQFCGGNASLNTTLPMLLPGVKLSTSPTDLRPMKQTWLQRFDGER
jgi:hypothetical protein